MGSPKNIKYTFEDIARESGRTLACVRRNHREGRFVFESLASVGAYVMAAKMQQIAMDRGICADVESD